MKRCQLKKDPFVETEVSFTNSILSIQSIIKKGLGVMAASLIF